MLKTTIDSYKKAKEIYQRIDDKFYDLEHGDIKNTDFQLNQILNDLNDFKRYLKYIKIDDLSGNYDNNTIAAVKHNIDLFNDALYYWNRFFLGSKYELGLKDPILLKYVPDLNLDPNEMSKYGDEKNLAKKIIATLTHVDHVLEYENSIKRMILGTMTQKEFNRIFDVLKHKIISPQKPKLVREYIELEQKSINRNKKK